MELQRQVTVPAHPETAEGVIPNLIQNLNI
jgi:hypothetical protein